MTKTKSTNVSLSEVAHKAGVSKSTASVALNHRPGAGAATRERILRIAQRLGYVPDARIASWMARV